MTGEQDDLAELREAILADEPELAGADFRLLDAGWDSLAVDVDDRLIFRFPRDEEGEEQFTREAGMLALARQHVSLPIPSIELRSTSRFYSRHEKIPGDHLSGPDYDGLNAVERHRLATELGRFYAELHAIPADAALAAGAEVVEEEWPAPDEMGRLLAAYLERDLLKKAEQAIAAWAALPPDPHGAIFGFFDGHGWNMAFDLQARRLNGLYDFGDAGVGPCHQDFIYSGFVSDDLTRRVIDAYELQTGRRIDRERVALEDGMLRLAELAEDGDHEVHAELIRRRARAWLEKA